MTAEKRQSPRVRSLHFVAEEGRIFRTLDVSVHGMLLETGSPPAVGSSLQARVAFGEEVADLRAVVVRHVALPGGATGVGLRFEQVDPRVQDLLRGVTTRE